MRLGIHPLQTPADLYDSINGGNNLEAELGQGIFGRGRRACEAPSLDQAALFELMQPGAQDLPGDERYINAQLTEATCAVSQVPQNIGCPGAAQQRHTLRERTHGRSYDAALPYFQGHDTNSLVTGGLLHNSSFSQFAGSHARSCGLGSRLLECDTNTHGLEGTGTGGVL